MSMKKYFFSQEEKDLLKVIKYTENKAEALNDEIKSLKKLPEKDDKDLNFESDIINKSRGNDSCSIDEITWDSLLNEANDTIPEDIGFEDILSQDDFKEAYKHLHDIDLAFEKKTGLQKSDFAFLAVAIALQCLRQYALDPWLKEMRKSAGSGDEKGRKNNTQAGWYYVETDKILLNRVPFDVQQYGDNKTIGGFLKGGDHRSMTLGHDPVLGWVFGTANIMTSTVTRRDLASAHVKCIGNQNKIYALADTRIMFEAIIDRISTEGKDGIKALAYAVLREGLHLLSDVMTKDSLPLPGIGTISPELANKLAKYGIDTAGVSTEITISWIINLLISMVHKLTFDESKEDPRFFEVRTRKIILYSNLIASTSNVIACYVSKKYELLDVGGLIVTISRLVSDVRFICKVKDEFVNTKLDAHFEGVNSEIDALYKRIVEDKK